MIKLAGIGKFTGIGASLGLLAAAGKRTTLKFDEFMNGYRRYREEHKISNTYDDLSNQYNQSSNNHSYPNTDNYDIQ